MVELDGITSYGRRFDLTVKGGIVKTCAHRDAPYDHVHRTIIVHGAKQGDEAIAEAVKSVMVEDAFLNLPAINRLAEALAGFGTKLEHCGHTVNL